MSHSRYRRVRMTERAHHLVMVVATAHIIIIVPLAHGQVLGVVHHVVRVVHVRIVAAAELQLDVTAPLRAARWRRTRPQFGCRDLDTSLGQQPGSQIRIEGAGHRQDGQIFGGDAAVLARHVRMQRVARLGNGAA